MIIMFEIKKLLKKRSALISLLFLLVWNLGSIVYVVNSTSWSKGGNENRIFGMEAIKMAKEHKSLWNNILTEDIINEVIFLNHEINNNSEYLNLDGRLNNEGYILTQDFSDIRGLINNSFCDFYTYDYYICDTLTPEQSVLFYVNRVNAIKNWLESPDASRLSNVEKKYFVESAEKLETPFIYSYMDGWNNALNYCSMIIILNVLVICILIAPTFSGEYQSGSDYIVLSSKYGRSKVIYAKFLSAYTIATVIYFTSIILFCSSIFILYGFDGYNCPIQANDYCWKSFYHLTNIEAMAVVVFIGYMGCILMSSVTILISSVVKTSFSAIIVPFLIIILPQMIDISNFPVYIQKIFTLLPHQTTIGLILLGYYNVFSIGEYIVTPIQLVPIIYLLIICLLIPFTIQGFRNHEII